jgi:hypothetical protein
LQIDCGAIAELRIAMKIYKEIAKQDIERLLQSNCREEQLQSYS